MIHNHTNLELLQELDKHVYGHTEAKKVLISLINRSKIRHYQKWGAAIPEEFTVQTLRCLLIGDSGTGKTHLVESLQKVVGFPLLKVDATSLTHTSASGGMKADDLRREIIKTAEKYMKLYPQTYHSLDGTVDQVVVFIDEFDKLSEHYDGSSHAAWNKSTQTHYLTLFEDSGLFKSVSWIFAGAFSGRKKEAQAVSGSIGFTHNNIKNIADDELLEESIVKYGMIPELVGRLNSIVELEQLTEDDYYKIIIENIIPKKIYEMSFFNISDYMPDGDKLREIAQKAAKSGQGVRVLSRELDKYMLDLEFNYEEYRYEQ